MSGKRPQYLVYLSQKFKSSLVTQPPPRRCGYRRGFPADHEHRTDRRTGTHILGNISSVSGVSTVNSAGAISSAQPADVCSGLLTSRHCLRLRWHSPSSPLRLFAARRRRRRRHSPICPQRQPGDACQRSTARSAVSARRRPRR